MSETPGLGKPDLGVLLLIGGRGSRLAEVSGGISKGLVTIDAEGEITGADHMAKIFTSLGIDDVSLLAYHYADQYEEFASDHGYSIMLQSGETGTGGAVEEAIALSGLSRQYLVMSVDTYISARDVQALISGHSEGTITWGVGLQRPELMMDDYHGLVIDAEHRVLGDIGSAWWDTRHVEQGQHLVVKAAAQVIDGRVFMDNLRVLRRFKKADANVDLYWQIMPMIEERNRRLIMRGRPSVLNAVILGDDLIDYGTPDRLTLTRSRYMSSSTKLGNEKLSDGR